MDAAEFARLSRLSVVCGDLGLRDGVAALGGYGWGERAIPSPPDLPCDRSPAPPLAPEYGARALGWLRAWREALDVVERSARQHVRPSWSDEDERSLAESVRAEGALARGSRAFVDGSEAVESARGTAATCRENLVTAEAAYRGAVADLERRATKARSALEAFRKEGPGVVLRPELASDEIRAALRSVDDARKTLREVRGQLEQLARDRPGLLARKRHQQQHDELTERCRAAEAAEAECGKRLDALCAAAYATRLGQLDAACSHALEQFRSARDEGAEVARLRGAADDAERLVGREEDAAAARFAALARDQAGLRARIAALEATRANHQQARANLDDHVQALRGHLAVTFAGLVCAAVAPVLAVEKDDAGLPAIAERVARCGVADLLAAPEHADLRELWLRRVPVTLSEVIVALSTVNDVCRHTQIDGPGGTDAAQRVSGAIIALARTPGLVPRAASSPRFFLALKSVYGLEMVRTRDFGWFTPSVAALVCGRAWARVHQQDWFQRMGAEIEHLLHAVMGGQPATDPRVRQVLRDATDLAEACMTGQRGL